MASEKRKSTLLFRIVLVVIIAAALGLSLIWEKQINAALGFTVEEEPAQPVDPNTASIDLDIHFVDVGQGDACILELPDDRVMLIDAGERDKENKLINYIDEHIRRKNKKLDYFDFVILTHSDSDHCGEMNDVLKAYPAKTFYRPNVAANYQNKVDPGIAANDLYGNYCTKDTARYWDAIEAGYAGVETLGGEVYATNALDPAQNLIEPENIEKGDAGYYSITFYTPTVDTYKTGKSDPDWNNYSPIMILEYEGKRIALSGDAEKEAEAEFVALAEAGQGKFSIFTDSFYVNLIKLGHHGSKTSSSQAYLDVMTTQNSCASTIAIASCGQFSEYGHPAPETIKRLTDMGFKQENIYTTHDDGTIVATVKRDENNGYAYNLFVGDAPAAIPTEPEMFAWRWLYVAGILLLAAIVVLLVLPFILRNRKYFEVKKKK